MFSHVPIVSPTTSVHIERTFSQTGLSTDVIHGYGGDVNSESLDQKQIERIAKMVRKINAYLSSLSGRCHQTHFPHNDRLKVAADECFASVEKLQTC